MAGGPPLGNHNATKNRPLTDAISRVLLENNGRKLRKLATVMVNKALKGDAAFAREVADRYEGKVKQITAISGVNGGPLEITQLGKRERARRIAFVLAQGAVAKAAESSKEAAHAAHQEG